MLAMFLGSNLNQNYIVEYAKCITLPCMCIGRFSLLYRPPGFALLIAAPFGCGNLSKSTIWAHSSYYPGFPLNITKQ